MDRRPSRPGLASRDLNRISIRTRNPKRRTVEMADRDDKYLEALLKRSTSVKSTNIRSTGIRSTSALSEHRTKRTGGRLSPIDALSTDCLYQIFSHCASISDLTTLAGVCTRWRDVVLDSYLWREVREDWEKFIDTLCLIHGKPNHIARKQLTHTRTIRMYGNNISRITQLRTKLLLFKNLTQLSLTNIFLHDIGELIALTPSIEVLQGYKIRCGTNGKVMLSMFSGLKRLRVLDLRFKELCEHMDYAFTMSSRRRTRLPTSLEEIHLSKVYDPEESYFILPSDDSPAQVLRRRWMEDAFVEKYQIFTQLTRLRTLYLGRCNGFTARVWRECMMPCLENLTHVTLAGWLHENNSSDENPVDDLELALRETIGNMRNIEQLDLADFVCGHGVVQGIQDIKARIHTLVEVQCADPDVPTPSTIHDLLNQHVIFCRFKFANKA